jgi:hypothetical protein
MDPLTHTSTQRKSGTRFASAWLRAKVFGLSARAIECRPVQPFSIGHRTKNTPLLNSSRAREIGYFILADEIMEIADDATNDYTTRAKEEGAEVVVNHDHISRSKLRVDTRKWMLSKMLPKVYGDKVAVGGDADAPPIQHQHHAVRWMTEEEAKARGWA